MSIPTSYVILASKRACGRNNLYMSMSWIRSVAQVGERTKGVVVLRADLYEFLQHLHRLHCASPGNVVLRDISRNAPCSYPFPVVSFVRSRIECSPMHRRFRLRHNKTLRFCSDILISCLCIILRHIWVCVQYSTD